MADAKGLAEALLAFQADRPVIAKTATNPHYKSKFAPLDEVLDKTIPALNRVGIVVVQKPTIEATLVTRLIHAATGEVEESEIPLLMAKEDPQGQGSALTYARRYALQAMLSLAPEEDDDGHSASRRDDPTAGASKGIVDVRQPAASTAQIARLRSNIGGIRKLAPGHGSVKWWDDLGRDGQKAISPSQASQAIEKTKVLLAQLESPELPPDPVGEPDPAAVEAFNEVVS